VVLVVDVVTGGPGFAGGRGIELEVVEVVVIGGSSVTVNG
jgi:hypothetical protein